MPHVLQTTEPRVKINLPFGKRMHSRMVKAAQAERQSLTQLVLRFVDDGLDRIEQDQKAEAAR